MKEVEKKRLLTGLKVLSALPKPHDENFVKKMDGQFVNLLTDVARKHASHAHPSLHPHISNLLSATTVPKRRKVLLDANAATGGGFLDFIKDAADKVVSGVKSAASFVGDVVTKVPSVIADPIIDFAKDKGAKMAAQAVTSILG